MDAPMDGADRVKRSFAFHIASERNGEHRADGVAQARKRGPRAAAKRAVIPDPGGDERVGELQQDGASPAEQHESFGVDTARGVGDRWHGKPLVRNASI